MPLKVPSFSGLAGALFDYISGTDQTQGLVGLTKIVFSPDGSAFTRVGPGAGLPVAPQTVAPDVVPATAALDLTSLTSALAFSPGGYGTGILFVPTYAGAAVLTAEQSQDGTNWFAATLHPVSPIGGSAGPKTQTITAATSGGLFKINFRGVAFFRLIVTTVGAGTVTPQLTATSGAALIGIECGDPTRTQVTALPLGAATFVAPAAVTVSGVSGTATLIAAARAGASGIGRRRISLVNESATAVRVCPAVGSTSGILLPGVVGASIDLETMAAVYGYVASGSATVSFVELY